MTEREKVMFYHGVIAGMALSGTEDMPVALLPWVGETLGKTSEEFVLLLRDELMTEIDGALKRAEEKANESR